MARDQGKRRVGRPRRTDEWTRLTVHVTKALKKRVAVEAIERDCDMSDLVTWALEQYLGKPRKP